MIRRPPRSTRTDTLFPYATLFRSLDPSQMGELLRAIDAYTGHAITRLAMQVSPHVMARPGELRMAEWSEFDLDNAVWKIPAERMQMRRPHEVPLSRSEERRCGKEWFSTCRSRWSP